MMRQPSLDLGVPAAPHPLAGEKRRKPYGTPAWTPGEDERLRDLTAAGYTDAEIALRLGRSAGSIAQRRGNLHLTAPRPQRAANEWTPVQDDYLREQFHRGTSDAGIGRVLGKSAAAVRSRRQALSLRRSSVR